MVTAAPEQTMRETAVGSLVKLAQDPHVPLNQVNIAAIKALSVAPQDERVIKMLKKFLEEGDNTAVVPVALRHLAGMRDASVDPYLKKMIDSDNPEIRIAVVQGLRFSCFPDRYSLLNQVIRKDREKVVVNTAIEQLRLMPTEASNKILQDIIDDGVLQENESRAARSAIVDIRRSVGTAMADPCAPPKKTAHENSKG
jgi:HEAT repeat protein